MIEVAGGILLAVFVLVTLPLWVVVFRFCLVLALIGGLVLAGLLMIQAARADDTVYIMPEIPDEATKRAALLFAYELNGNSMVRHPSLGSIDLTGPSPKGDRVIPLTKPLGKKPAP